MSLDGFFNPYVITIDRGQSCSRAAGLMRDENVGCLVVVEADDHGSRPVGIVTDRDIVVRVVAHSVSPELISVGDIMSADLQLISHREGVYGSIEVMRDYSVKRLPVVDDDGYLVGIVTLNDMLNLLSGELDSLAAVSQSQVSEGKTSA